MHRVRQCLPYLKENGWEAEVITVDTQFIESYSTDALLLKTIPDYIKIHYVKAFPVKLTRKFGIGSLSMRSFFQYKKKGNQLLSTGKFDLVFFSTTAFHVMALGPYWKKKFKIPFVLDMQDPWRNDFYLTQPPTKRPPKFKINYYIDKYLEAKTVPLADGIISVSETYCSTFLNRYKNFKTPCKLITFGGVPEDFSLIQNENYEGKTIELNKDKINIIYIGRGGHDMRFALTIFFSALKKGLELQKDLYRNIQCWFIGTSYATKGNGIKTILPIAEELGVGDFVQEITDRIPYFESIALLKKAAILFVPGSTDAGYSASKIYPYILAEKPFLACFHESSNIIDILKSTSEARIVKFHSNEASVDDLIWEIYEHLTWLINNRNQNFKYNKESFEIYSAKSMTLNMVKFFNSVS